MVEIIIRDGKTSLDLFQPGDYAWDVSGNVYLVTDAGLFGLKDGKKYVGTKTQFVKLTAIKMEFQS